MLAAVHVKKHHCAIYKVRGVVVGRNDDWNDDDDDHDHDDDHDDDCQSNIETGFEETHVTLPQCGVAAFPQHEFENERLSLSLARHNVGTSHHNIHVV